MNYKELAKDILKLHKPDPDVILEIAREQQATLKQFDESFKEGVEVLSKAHAQLIAAQESEAVWKTEADKANQRRMEEIKKLEDKTKYLIPYCFECGAEYEDKPCCPDKAISYIHPRFLHKLKVYEFGVQKILETNQKINMYGEVIPQYPFDTSS
jgi:hypothetical protein